MQSTHPTPSSSPALPTALPTSVAWLGYGGLLPFAALAGIGWWAPGTTPSVPTVRASRTARPGERRARHEG